MRDILFQYELNPTTWAYLSALLTIGIYFKFGRFWSVRNLDLIGLIAFSPGLLLVFHGLDKVQQGRAQFDQGLAQFGQGLVQFGYAWMFVAGGLFLLRLLLDPVMVRRPLLEPNLNASGLTFTGTALLVFLIANVLANRPPERLEHKLPSHDATLLQSPGYAAFYYVASFSDKPPQEFTPRAGYPNPGVEVIISRIATIAALLTLVVGMVLIGFRHFGNIQTGVAAASLFLLLPYTDQMIGRMDHMVPAALLVCAVAAYRRPLPAGLLLGTAAGLSFYPLFLFPLWCSFYSRRGLTRFLIGMATALLVMVFLLLFLHPLGSPVDQLRQMFGLTIFDQDRSSGFWCHLHWAARIPVLAVFAVVSASLGLWPAHKNLGTLLSCSAAVMLGAQYCQGHEGGLYMAWYLPLLVLTIFRPNLEDRVALSAVIERTSTWAARLMAWPRGKRPPANGPAVE